MSIAGAILNFDPPKKNKVVVRGLGNFFVFFLSQTSAHATGTKTLPQPGPFITAVPAAFFHFFLGKFSADYGIT
jgi:hypothetical protein